MLVGLRSIREQMFSRQQLKRAAAFTDEDLVQIGKCRRPHNRVGFGYQVAFVRLFNRFPQQQPFEVMDKLVTFSAAQLGFDARLIELYRKRQPTISGHQHTITDYLGLRHFTDAESRRSEQFVFEESWHLEQTAALNAQAREFLKEQRILEPGEFRIGRIVGEQRARSREHSLTLILACIVYWQAREISRVLSLGDHSATGWICPLLEHVSPIEWDNVVLYGQYILDRKLVRRHRRPLRAVLSYKITRICLVP